MGRLLASLAVLLTLTGCSTVAVPPEGLSPDEIAAVRAQVVDSYWAATRLSDDKRPPNPRVTLISAEEWSFAYVKCMFIAGFEDYATVPGGGYTIGDRDYEDRPEEEIVADFLCSTSYEVDGQYEGFFNEAQLDYVFDYYATYLVPCLSLRGFDVVSPPDREQFAAGFGGWHPYFSIRPGQEQDFFDDDRVPLDCPPLPEGMPDRGLARMWELR